MKVILEIDDIWGGHVNSVKRDFVKINQKLNHGDVEVTPRTLDYLQALRGLFHPTNHPLILLCVNHINLNI